MLANYLAAALRNLARNGLYAGVTIAGLAIAFTAAILIALFVRDEYSYDRFIPGHERTYRVEQAVRVGSDSLKNVPSQAMLAARLKDAFPEFEAVGRLAPAALSAVRHGEVGGREEFLTSADPDFFKAMPLPAIAGDPAHALETPDGVVITRAKARQYFGQDRPLGQVLEIEKHPYRVMAVLEDYPSQTHLQSEVFTSGLSPFLGLKPLESGQYGTLSFTVVTYVRLKPGASIDAVRARLPAFVQRELVAPAPPVFGKVSIDMHLTPLTGIHLRAIEEGGGKPRGDEKVIASIAAVGVLIVIVAAINFITLMTARAARRAVEVGVRKAAGAGRRDLIVQFMGEAFLYVLFSAVLAMAMAEVLLPALNAFLQRRIELNYLRDPQIMAGLAGLTLTTALAAGAYPALVLSGFNPAAVLKGQVAGSDRGGRSRQGLVIFQFTVLIALILAALTIYRQTAFALGEGMRVNSDQTVQVFVSPCTVKLRERVQAAPGVQAAACSSSMALNYNNYRDTVRARGREANISFAPVDFGFFEVYGLKPLAGRLFDPKRAADEGSLSSQGPPPIVLNETAVRHLGFASPAAAVGQSLTRRYRQGRPEVGRSEIIGVVPDFTFGTLRKAIEPTFYFVVTGVPDFSSVLNVKLNGAMVPEGLKGIDRAVSRYGDGRPVSRRFTDQIIERLYQATIAQGVTIGICAGIALSIACLGLFALSAYTTERRTKEIGVRKAMGASTSDVLKLLIWQFTRPVLVANLLAWPLAFIVMRRWLEGFAYRIDLAPWTFLAAGLAALLIAWATVFVHALKVARAKPVGALRYE
jgi:putative ABC transport system permease protein